MTPDERLERAAERFAESVDEAVRVRVQVAWSLERDRLYAEIAELRDEVHLLSRHFGSHMTWHETTSAYSVKVPE